MQKKYHVRKATPGSNSLPWVVYSPLADGQDEIISEHESRRRAHTARRLLDTGDAITHAEKQHAAEVSEWARMYGPGGHTLLQSRKDDGPWGTVQTFSVGSQEVRRVAAAKAMTAWQTTWHDALNHTFRIIDI